MQIFLILDGDHFVVIDALESSQVLRMAPAIGLVTKIHGSATARAVLPYLDLPEQTRLLGVEPDGAVLEQFAATIARGYAVNDGDIVAEAIAIASAILDKDEQPLGALVLTGPSKRLDPARREELGLTLISAARSLR
jgi:DNA-binding IclR family transcriptional regulator